ncbi:hypothetical protein BB558_002960 [Smittium angustum]|uniref:Uncharacterized protein n=1 Tax=Smittium angustum TaxID=133377 RepID=A0A2U1J7L6_SMIAN|nr:hypothetical protein BB558_002960 [Smittium angustum]
MPKPTHPDAPHFEGKDVLEFLEEMKLMAKATENDLDVIIKKVWNVRTASMLLEECVAVGKNLISASKCDEDKEVAKLSSVLSSQALKSGFIEQGKQRITNEFITIKEAAMYIKRIYLNEQLYDFLEDANIVNSKEVKRPRFQMFRQGKEEAGYQKNDAGYVCIYCNKSGHGKRERQELTKDFKDGLVLFDSQGKILNKNSEVITPNYGRGGMMVIVRNPENKKR